MTISFSLALIFAGISMLLSLRPHRVSKDVFFRRDPEQQKEQVSAIRLDRLNRGQIREWFQHRYDYLVLVLGKRFILTGAVLLSLAMVAGIALAIKLQMRGSGFLALWLAFPCFTLLAWWWMMSQRRKAKFSTSFPDALNIMMSAVTAGESMMAAMAYVGKLTDSAIGREFAYMAERFKLGESTDVVFERSILRYPYPAYLFFIVALKANISRGGALKPVMSRLIKVLVESKSLEKKKYALTSEARLSAKIVASFPVIFGVIMYYISPSNVHFILFDPDGRIIFWYVLISELLGLGIIWALVKGVR
ncbi:type II secretion system F family protein [Aliagarivorans taiwanensis]|uniref:type II secretion system F family protein n=1 Tax=Aliagarivorans taiwanensis TaxID=561966 RepID=UPI000400B7B0|nr:type II secretion system F family protein [Aliagarivorans taiwanensis]